MEKVKSLLRTSFLAEKTYFKHPKGRTVSLLLNTQNPTGINKYVLNEETVGSNEQKQELDQCFLRPQ